MTTLTAKLLILDNNSIANSISCKFNKKLPTPYRLVPEKGSRHDVLVVTHRPCSYHLENFFGELITKSNKVKLCPAAGRFLKRAFSVFGRIWTRTGSSLENFAGNKARRFTRMHQYNQFNTIRIKIIIYHSKGIISTLYFLIGKQHLWCKLIQKWARLFLEKCKDLMVNACCIVIK